MDETGSGSHGTLIAALVEAALAFDRPHRTLIVFSALSIWKELRVTLDARGGGRDAELEPSLNVQSGVHGLAGLGGWR